MLKLGYSPWGNSDMIEPFDKLFSSKQNIASEGFKGVDAVILWGGTDVHPSYYKQKKHTWNGAGNEPSERDRFEWKTMLFCKANHIPLIGVCRGAQFLCVGAGGSLIQHVEGHGNSHPVNALGKSFKVTSTHHQMMYPFEVKHTMLACSDPPLSRAYETEESNHNLTCMFSKPEPEIVFFPQLKAVAIQGHPEYADATKEFIDYSLECVQEYCLKV